MRSLWFAYRVRKQMSILHNQKNVIFDEEHLLHIRCTKKNRTTALSSRKFYDTSLFDLRENIMTLKILLSKSGFIQQPSLTSNSKTRLD